MGGNIHSPPKTVQAGSILEKFWPLEVTTLEVVGLEMQSVKLRTQYEFSNPNVIWLAYELKRVSDFPNYIKARDVIAEIDSTNEVVGNLYHVLTERFPDTVIEFSVGRGRMSCAVPGLRTKPTSSGRRRCRVTEMFPDVTVSPTLRPCSMCPSRRSTGP